MQLDGQGVDRFHSLLVRFRGLVLSVLQVCQEAHNFPGEVF